MKNVMIVDDHPMVRAGLAHLVNAQPDFTVCGEAGSPGEVLEMLSGVRPDLLISDITMPGRSGAEFIRDVLALQPELPILVLSMHDETIYAERALRAGARGYIMKEAHFENVLRAMRQVLSGQIYVSEKMASRILNIFSGTRPRGSRSPIESLSDREFEIFQLIGPVRQFQSRDVGGPVFLKTEPSNTVNLGQWRQQFGHNRSITVVRIINPSRPGQADRQPIFSIVAVHLFPPLSNRWLMGVQIRYGRRDRIQGRLEYEWQAHERTLHVKLGDRIAAGNEHRRIIETA